MCYTTNYLGRIIQHISVILWVMSGSLGKQGVVVRRGGARLHGTHPLNYSLVCLSTHSNKRGGLHLRCIYRDGLEEFQDIVTSGVYCLCLLSCYKISFLIFSSCLIFGAPVIVTLDILSLQNPHLVLCNIGVKFLE